MGSSSRQGDFSTHYLGNMSRVDEQSLQRSDEKVCSSSEPLVTCFADLTATGASS